MPLNKVNIKATIAMYSTPHVELSASSCQHLPSDFHLFSCKKILAYTFLFALTASLHGCVEGLSFTELRHTAAECAEELETDLDKKQVKPLGLTRLSSE